MGVGGWGHAPAGLPPRMTRYPLYRRLGGPQGRSRRVQKISPHRGFDPRTVQPVALCSTDWAIPALTIMIHLIIIVVSIFTRVRDRGILVQSGRSVYYFSSRKRPVRLWAYLLARVKPSGREDVYAYLSSAEAKNLWRCSFTPACLHSKALN